MEKLIILQYKLKNNSNKVFMLTKMNSSKNKKVQLLLVALTLPLISKAEDSIFENNLEIQNNKTKIESAQYDFKINRSFFLPELSINTGIGSDYKKNNNETDKGPYLFLESKINLYRGGRDQNLEKIIQTTKFKLNIENEKILRFTKIKAFKIISEVQSIENDNIFLNDEIKENEIQMKMAKKKADAGLTTSADLLDFQIKTETLTNEISNNNFKISDLEKELFLLFGNKLTLEQIKNELMLTRITTNAIIDIQTLPEFMILTSEFNNSKLETTNARSEYYPSIDLEGKFGSITPAKKFLGNKTEYQIALNLIIPIFSGGSTAAKFSKAILESSQKERELRQLEIELKKDIEQEKKKQELYISLISSLDLSLEKASKYKKLTIFEYKKGIKNSSDVINASDRKLEINRKINELKKESKILTFSFKTNFQPIME